MKPVVTVRKFSQFFFSHNHPWARGIVGSPHSPPLQIAKIQKCPHVFSNMHALAQAGIQDGSESGISVREPVRYPC
jgi:hypothetical protein